MPSPNPLALLRAELARQGLDGFVVPLTDEHGSEYVGEYAQRLAWLTGFGGSAGTAVVLHDGAAIATDGRYTLQVRDQVDAADWRFIALPAETVAGWLADHVPEGGRVGYDPWLHPCRWVEEMHAALAPRAAELVAVAANPVDAVWADRPAPSPAPLAVHADALAGRTSAAKRADMADRLSAEGADSAVLTALDSIAWTLNVRGQDVAHTPVARAFLIVHADATADLFVAPEKLTDAVRQHLGNAVRTHDYAAFPAALSRLAGRRVAVDPDRSAMAVVAALEVAGANVLARRDLALDAKAAKTPAEIAGHRAASVRDGAALCRFLRWVEAESPRGTVTELSAAAKLLGFRQATGLLRDTSFDTISATGPHGAIPHYRVDAASNAPLLPGQLFLIDSGGQYADGTTDVTRVVPVTEPTAEMRDRFTRVLRAHVAVATALFPPGTVGAQIDAMARRPLWQAGLDYAHGTGHGVGAFLSVHEGPARLALPSYPGGGPFEPLRAGMILSNEPGYYQAGEYGIRIENLLLVGERRAAGSDMALLGFETLTFAPIERDLIEPALLTASDKTWLNAYHGRVVEVIAPELEGEDRAWLVQKCSALG